MKHAYRFIQGYTHNGRIGVLVEFGFELSVTAQAQAFAGISKDLAMHIAATNPESIEALLAQPFVKDDSVTVEQWLSEASVALEDKVEISRFVRWDTEPGAGPTAPGPPSGPAVVMRLKRVG